MDKCKTVNELKRQLRNIQNVNSAYLLMVSNLLKIACHKPTYRYIYLLQGVLVAYDDELILDARNKSFYKEVARKLDVTYAAVEIGMRREIEFLLLEADDYLINQTIKTRKLQTIQFYKLLIAYLKGGTHNEEMYVNSRK